MRISKNTREVLKAIALVAGISIAIVIPNAAVALSAILKLQKKGKKRYELRKHVEKLHEEGMLTLSGDTITLTKRGKDLLAVVALDQLSVPSTKWDGVWRVVAYDIPIGKDKSRDLFRKTIRQIGFKQIQKSIFVFPYESKEEIAIAAHVCNVSSYVLYMHAQDIPRESDMIKIFQLDTK